MPADDGTEELPGDVVAARQWIGDEIPTAEFPSRTDRAKVLAAARAAGCEVAARRVTLRVLRRRQDGVRPNGEGSSSKTARNMVLMPVDIDEVELAVRAPDGSRRLWAMWEVAGRQAKLKSALGWRSDGSVRVARGGRDVSRGEQVLQWVQHGADEYDPGSSPVTAREAALAVVTGLGGYLIAHRSDTGETLCPLPTPERIRMHMDAMHGYQGRAVSATPELLLAEHVRLHATSPGDHEHVARPLGER